MMLTAFHPTAIVRSVPGPAIGVVLLLAALGPATVSARPGTFTVTVGEGPFRHGAVAGDHAMASEAGARVLAEGGNAVDAAVATALTQGVVRPDSAGLGGGGFLVISRPDGEAVALDAREVAPAAATRDMYLSEGRPVPESSVLGGKAVAVPSLLQGLHEAHRRFGSLPWKRLFPGAIAAAWRTVVTSDFAETLAEESDVIDRDPSLRRLFRTPEGHPLAAGSELAQPEMARALAELADSGPGLLTTGWIGQDLVRAVRTRGGILTMEDLAAYRPVWRTVITGRLGRYTIASMPPPSSGGVALVETLGILSALGDWSRLPLPMRSHMLALAMKHAFADRARYLGDPDQGPVPVASLISPGRARRIAHVIRKGTKLTLPEHGNPQLPEDHGTTHVSVLDSRGGAVAMTMTINLGFGAGFRAPASGIVLNDEMDDFATLPGQPNAFGLVQADRNCVGPGKRPLSSMTPTIVRGPGGVRMVVGGSGGPRIISGVLQVLTGHLLLGMDLRRAVEAPRIHHQWMPDRLDVEETMPPEVIRELTAYGHDVQAGSGSSVIQAITRVGGEIRAVSDPRKGGLPAGY